jgi:nucleoid-associated protein YgaU
MRVEDGVSVITVQPGFTLWGIAEANFGDGIAYVQIFQENRENIRDPDLIFPGQIFRLPDLPRSGSEP